MERLESVVRLIRQDFSTRGDLYERYLERDRDRWFRLCTALDSIGDAALALLDFEEHGLGSSDGEKYLRLYGMLQAVVLQQDAITTLQETFLPRAASRGHSPAWVKIRDTRNAAAGHPTAKYGAKEDGKLRVMLTRITLSTEGFTLLLFPEKTGEMRTEDIALPQLYADYKTEALALLEEVQHAQQASSLGA